MEYSILNNLITISSTQARTKNLDKQPKVNMTWGHVLYLLDSTLLISQQPLINIKIVGGTKLNDKLHDTELKIKQTIKYRVLGQA